MTHPNNPAGVKKALQLVKEIPAAQGVFTSAQADMRGRELTDRFMIWRRICLKVRRPISRQSWTGW